MDGLLYSQKDEVLNLGVSYTLVDISQSELDSAPDFYSKICADICLLTDVYSQYDFIFSKLCAEHVSDGRKKHENIFKMLKPGGCAFHFSQHCSPHHLY